jgi:Tripartite tricarboxylate transporter family receptor
MKFHRRRFLHLAAGAATLPAVSRIARAQTYPTRPITMVVPYAAGGGSDVSARIVSEHMSRTLGQQVIIENIVGAGGTTGSARAMRANPDGYTIEMGGSGTHATAVALYPKLAYKPDIDFAPIGLVAWGTSDDRGKKGLSAQGPQRIRDIRQGKRTEAEHGSRRSWFSVVQLRSIGQFRSWGEADVSTL